MELADLRYFDAVCRAGSFAGGARLSHVSPPAMTKAIRRLEAELGISLFARTTRRVAPTEAGRILQARVREVLDRVDALGREIDELGEGVHGELHVAAMEVFSIHLLPVALVRLAREHRDLEPHVYEMVPQRMERWLLEGRLDACFTVGPTGTHREVETVSLGRSRGVVVCGRGHPLHGRGRIRPAELESHPFVVPRFFGLEHLPPIDRFPDDVHPRRVGATIELLQMGIQLVAGGAYLGYFPEISIRDRLADGSLEALSGLRPGPPFDLLALLPPGRPKRAAIALVEEMKRVVARSLRTTRA